MTIKQNNQILIIDSNALGYRALYTTGNLSHEKSRTGVIFGFLHQVFKIAKKYKSNHIIFCWDSKQSFRKIIYPEYKSGRLKKKKELSGKEKYNLNDAYRQFGLLKREILFKLGFVNVFMEPGYESDDLIAAITKNKKNEYIIFSNDSDLYQLISDNVSYHDLGKDKLVTKKIFRKEHGIDPDYWAEVKAIAGCATDDVLGIKGIGDNRAIDYIQGRLNSGKLFERIKEGKDNGVIERNRKLVYLPFDDDIKLRIKKNEFKREKFIEVFNRHSFRSFLEIAYFKGLEKVFEL